MKRSTFFARPLLAVVLSAAALAFPSCNSGIVRMDARADLTLTIILPQKTDVAQLLPAALRAQSRLIDPDTSNIGVTVQRSGITVAQQTFSLSVYVPTTTVTVTGIPIDPSPATVTVVCRSGSGTILSQSTTTVVIDSAGGTEAAALTLEPTTLAGAAIDLGALASYGQNGAMSAAAGGSTLYRITTTDALGAYALSAGLTEGTAVFYSADGTVAAKYGSTPEQWAVVTFGGSTPAYVLFSAPASAAASATLGAERAVYVTPTGTGSGTKGAPLSGSSFNTTYATFAAPTRFLLAAGDYPGKFDLANQRSIYGGFDSAFSARDIAANMTRFTGTYSTTPDQILRANAISYVALDGITVTPNMTAENGTAVDYATVRAVNSGIRVSGCTIHTPRQTLTFSFTASGNVFAGLSIQGQAAGQPIVVICNSFLGRGQNWDLGFNSGASAATVSLISILSSSADILISGNVLDGGWETDTNTNSATETAGAVYVSSGTGQPWIIGNTIAAAGGTTTQVTLSLAAVRGAAALNGRLVNNLMFALKEYVATIAETNLLYPAGSTNQFNLLTYNYLANMYQGTRNSFYYDTVTRAQTVAALNGVANAANNSGGAFNTATYATYKTALDAIMVDFDGPANDRSAYATHDFRLKAGAPAAVATGGLDFSVAASRPSGFPAIFAPYVRYDRHGNVRTSGAWSIGAHQAGY